MWVSSFFPNKKPNHSLSIIEVKKSWFSKLLQAALHNKFGDFLDTSFQKITLKKWHIKFEHLEKEEFQVAMKSTKNVSKHHPQNFQKKVIDLLNTDYEKMKEQHNIELSPEHA